MPMRRMSDDYTAFFRSEYERVVRTVQLVIGEHEAALDIAQEAFTRLYRNWTRISRYEQPDACVRRIAINLAISHVRRRRVQERALRLLVPETPQAAPIDAGDVVAAVRRLPPAQRAATVLYYFEDQPSSEIARILGCSESTARVHLHKARSKLARMLDVPDGTRSFDVTR